MTPASVVIDAEFFDPARQIKAQDAAARSLAHAAAQFLHEAFPTVEIGTVDCLRDALIGFVCCGTEEQLRNIERQKEMMARYPLPKGWEPETDEQRLIKLVNERDKLSEQVQQIETGIESIPEELQGMMRATSLVFYNEQLESVEKRISELQESIEQRARAVNPQPETTSEESAKP